MNIDALFVTVRGFELEENIRIEAIIRGVAIEKGFRGENVDFEFEFGRKRVMLDVCENMEYTMETIVARFIDRFPGILVVVDTFRYCKRGKKRE